MILNDNFIDLDTEMFNPSITLHKTSKVEKHSFTDPNSYFILSEAGKNYTISENSTILINPSKDNEQNFTVTDINSFVLSTSKALFNGTKPIEGKAKIALELAILKAGKKESTLKNRL